MEKQQVKKTEKETESPAIREVSDDSLDKVNGGVQPDPLQGCKYCGSTTSHALSCPIHPNNIKPRL